MFPGATRVARHGFQVAAASGRTVIASRHAWYLSNVVRVEHGWLAGLAGIAVAAAAAGGAPRASADELELALGEGRVTLIAAGVPLGDVLAEWARAGGTRFEGAAEMGGLPVSLHLEDVAELEALRLLLRPAAGFLAAPRPPQSLGASIYDRVRIRSARRAPRPAAAEARPRPAWRPGPVREAPPALSEADQRERLLRLLGTRAAPEVVVARPPSDTAREGGLYGPTAPRPGMIVEPGGGEP